MHVPWTLAAARAGKHVLCEKPIALSARQAAELKEVANKVCIMEACMVRFHPQWLRVQELVRSGAVGDLRALQVYFSYFNRDGANIRNQLASGGGALYDIGCYAIVAGRFFFEAEPLRAMALIDRQCAAGLWPWAAAGFHRIHTNSALSARAPGWHTAARRDRNPV
jgi:predicted dehydrogenase